MKEFNPEKEYKKLNRKFTKKHLLIITSVIFVLAVIGISFANYSVNPNSILIIDSKVGEFSKGTFANQFMEDIQNEEGSGIEVDEANNLRYTGKTPNNYVTFNNETWRIIGEFNDMYECPEDTEGKEITTDNYTDNCKKTRLLKIIKDEALGGFSWDSTPKSTNNGYGVNEWSTSAMQKALNEAYYNSTNIICYRGSNKSPALVCDFSQDGNMKGLNETARKQVARVMWNTGTVDGITKTYQNIDTKDMYTAERSDNNGKICTSGTYCNDTIPRTTKWIGKVGLMYPSDYGYATSGSTTSLGKTRGECINYKLNSWGSKDYETDCTQNNWLFNNEYLWSITPLPIEDKANGVFGLFDRGIFLEYTAISVFDIKPVVYLKSDVQITGGKGTQDEPYQIGIPVPATEVVDSITDVKQVATDGHNNKRYIGATPNNYVTFNGEDWRIIGVFNNMYECPDDDQTVTTENYEEKCSSIRLLKIIRNQLIGARSWDSTKSSVNYGWGINEWSQAAIQIALNDAYYNSQKGICYGTSNLSTHTCDFTEAVHYPTKGLDATARNQVARVMWNTGTVDGATKTYDNTNTKEMYIAERSGNNGKICTSGIYCTDQIDRTTKWIGKVGLMYPSDYGYATSGGETYDRDACLNYQLYKWNESVYQTDCAQNSWLLNSDHQWTLTPAPHISNATRAFVIDRNGYVTGLTSAQSSYGVRPVVYLKSDVQIIGGKGTQDEPYQVG